MKKLVVFYDDWCPNCTRFAMLVKKNDWLGLIEIQKMRELDTKTSTSKFLNSLNHQENKQRDFFTGKLDLLKAQQQMASFEIANSKKRKNENSVLPSTKIFYGFISIYRILLRLPIYWILFFYTFPFLFLIKITGMGDFFYDQIAIKRRIIPLHCDETCKAIHGKK